MSQNMRCLCHWTNGTPCKTPGQPDNMPVACYSYKGTLVNLTGKRIANLFREAVKAIHPRMSKAELSRYSAHSLQVWACV